MSATFGDDLAAVRDAERDDPAKDDAGQGFVPGGRWLEGATEHVPAVWGDHDRHVLWSQGEPLILAGPPGVGKTTLAQQLVIKRCGVSDLDLLGHMVTPDPDRAVAYVAADRPKQAQRSMRRMVSSRYDWETLNDRLIVWEGPLPFDVLESPTKLAVWLSFHRVGMVIVDSIKDVAGDVADGKVGAAFNMAMQHVVAAGIEFCGLHHPRKATEGNRKPCKLDDVYGSRWLTAGAGSVVYLHGEPGDAVVELLHLKQPADVVGPLRVAHEHGSGRSYVVDPVTVPDVLLRAGEEGTTAKNTAALLFAKRDPTANEVERARRKLDSEEAQGRARKVPGRSRTATRYVSTEGLVSEPEQDREQLTLAHGGARPPENTGHDSLTVLTEAVTPPPTPLKGGRDQKHEHEHDHRVVDGRASEGER